MKTIFPKTSYYAKDQNGSIRVWTIGAVLENEDTINETGKIKIEHGMLVSYPEVKYEYIHEGLQSRTIEEQTIMRVESRIHDKIKKGYVIDFEQAKNGQKVNLLGYRLPMLAKKDKEVLLNWNKPVYVQRKLNGHRCLITNDCGNLVAYSRGGEQINSIPHILKELNGLIDDEITLDGELYVHGLPLQKISSMVRRFQDDSKMLEYHIYDIMLDLPFSERFEYIKKIQNASEQRFENVVIVNSYRVNNRHAAETLSNGFVSEGYEGAMFRTDDSKKYEDGKRSKSLVKFKGKNGKRLEDDFLIIGVKQSSDGWAILTCATKDGQNFDVSAPGTIEQKTNAFLSADRLIGQFVHIEYPEHTESGKPSQPVATHYRDTAIDSI